MRYHQALIKHVWRCEIKCKAIDYYSCQKVLCGTPSKKEKKTENEVI